MGPTIGWVDRPGGLGGRTVTSIDDAGIGFMALTGNSILWCGTWGLLQTDRSSGVSVLLHGRESALDFGLTPIANDAFVYWTALDSVVRRLDRATDEATVFAALPIDPTPASLYLDQSRLWIGAAGLIVLPTSGGDAGFTIDLGERIDSFAIDGTSGYAAVFPRGGGFFDDIVYFDSSGDAGVVVAAQELTQALAVDADFIYWGTGAKDGGAGALLRLPRDGGAVQHLLDFPMTVHAVAVSEGGVYLATWPNIGGPSPDQSIYKYNAATGELVELAAGLRFVLQIVPAPEALYWIESDRRLARIAPLP